MDNLDLLDTMVSLVSMDKKENLELWDSLDKMEAKANLDFLVYLE